MSLTTFSIDVSTPSCLRYSTISCPKRSSDTAASSDTSSPRRTAATAWVSPLPPGDRKKSWASLEVSRSGSTLVRKVASMTAPPTTITRPFAPLGLAAREGGPWSCSTTLLEPSENSSRLTSCLASSARTWFSRLPRSVRSLGVSPGSTP